MRTATKHWLFILLTLAVVGGGWGWLLWGADAPPPAADPPAEASELSATFTAGDATITAEATTAAPPTSAPAGGSSTGMEAPQWLRGQLDDVVGDVSDAIGLPRLTLPSAVATAALAVAATASVVLLLVSLKQYVLWRRERLPGPASITEVVVADVGYDGADELDGKRMTAQLVEQLARIGLYPTSQASGGPDGVVLDVDEVASAAAPTSGLARLASALKSAFTVQTGFTIDSTAYRTDSGVELVLDIRITRTRSSYDVVAASGPDADAAVERAAFHIYERLIRRQAVRLRLGNWDTWSDPEALRRYHQAAGEADLPRAEDLLTGALHAEPGNVRLRMLLGDIQRQRAEGRRGRYLNRGEDERRRADRHYALAMGTYARALLLRPELDDARMRLAVLLSYDGAADGLALLDDDESAHVRAGLDGVQRLGPRLPRLRHRLGWPRPSAGRPWDPVEDYGTRRDLKVLSLRQFRRVVFEQRYRRVLRLWLTSAANRRLLRGLMRPFSRDRRSRRDVSRAAIVAVKADIRRDAGAALGSARLWWFSGHLALMRVRCRVRMLTDRANTRYNVAVAYEAMARTPGVDGSRLRRKALVQLGLAMTELPVIAGTHLAFIETDPDFAELRGTAEFTEWRSRFGRRDLDAERVEVQRRCRETVVAIVYRRRNEWDRLGSEWSRGWGVDAATLMVEAIGALDSDVQLLGRLAAWMADPGDPPPADLAAPGALGSGSTKAPDVPALGLRVTDHDRWWSRMRTHVDNAAWLARRQVEQRRRDALEGALDRTAARHAAARAGARWDALAGAIVRSSADP